MFKNTLLNPIQNLLFATLIACSIHSNVQAQTVGDTFIDTSEWVQSTSPIRTDGVVNGYITETIVRGYRGADFDRYYNPNPGQQAIEFSNKPKIQPVVYENSEPVNNTSLEPPIRPTPDPLVQAANHSTSPYTGNQGFRSGVSQATFNSSFNQSNTANHSNVVSNSVYQPNVRGFSSSYPVQQPNQNYAPAPQVPGRMIQTGYVPPIVQPTQVTSTYATTSPYPSPYPTYYTNQTYGQQGYVSTQFTTPPPAYTSTLTNCCDPVYRQAQFVAPNVNSGANALRTYPQYNGNPYPRPGYGISQPYVRDTWAPIIPLRQMPYGTYLGQGIIGQPVAYVDGEPVRNFLRYVFP